MKKLSLLVLFLASLFVNAQDISVELTKSKMYKDKKKHTNLLFSENDGKGGLIVVRNARTRFRLTSKEYYIDHYNSDLSLIETYTLKNEKWASLKGILIKDNKINLIQLVNKSGKKIVNRWVSPIDHLKFTKQELFNLSKEALSNYFSAVLKPKSKKKKVKLEYGTDLAFSFNKKYMVFTFDAKGQSKDAYLLLVYDASFNKIYDRVFVRDIKDRLFDVSDVAIDEKDASIYLLGKVFENNVRRTKNNKKTNYHYEMYKINKDNEKKVSFKSEKFISSLTILRRREVLYLVGFYSEKNDWRTKGVCRFNLAPDLSIIDKTFNPFSERFLKDKYKKGSDVSDWKKEIRNIDYRSIFLDKNNNIIINAEEFYITFDQHYNPGLNGRGGTWTTTTTYHYVDIISTKMDSSGKLLWARNINKHQTNPLYASYVSTIVDDTVYFVLNAADNIKTKRGGLCFGNKLFNFSGINLFIFSISSDGTINYKKLIDKDDLNVWYNVKGANLSKDLNSIYIEGRKGRKKQLLKLEIH